MQTVESMFQEIENRPPDPSGMSDDEIISEYIRLDQLVKAKASDRSWLASVLAAKASDERNGQKTVHVENSTRSQKVKVEFGTEWKILDDDQIETVRELLGETRFREVFKVSYAPRIKELKLFLNTSSTDERVRTAKDIVKEVVKEKDKPTPYVSVEKS